MRKQILTLLGAGLIGLMHPAAAQAGPLDFTFSFSNVNGNVSGKVTGEIFGLTVGGSPATNVIVDTYPAGLEPPSPPQTIFSSIDTNDFKVNASDQIFSQDFDATTAMGDLNLRLTDGSNTLSRVFGSNRFVNNDDGLAGITYTLVTPVPEPSSVTLLGIGLGVAALWQLRRRQREGAAA